MKLEQAARQALEALELHLNGCGVAIATRIAYDSLREALSEQAEQEPVALTAEQKRNVVKHWAFDCGWDNLRDGQIDDLELLVTGVLNAVKQNAAPVRTKDLTDDEIAKVLDSLPMTATHEEIIRAVIAADREKNRGTA